MPVYPANCLSLTAEEKGVMNRVESEIDKRLVAETRTSVDAGSAVRFDFQFDQRVPRAVMYSISARYTSRGWAMMWEYDGDATKIGLWVSQWRDPYCNGG